MEFWHKPKYPSVCSNHPESLALLPYCIFVRKASVDMRRNTSITVMPVISGSIQGFSVFVSFFASFFLYYCCNESPVLAAQQPRVYLICALLRSQIHGLSSPSYSLFSGRSFYLQSLPLSVPSRTQVSTDPLWAPRVLELMSKLRSEAGMWTFGKHSRGLHLNAFLNSNKNLILCVHIWIHSIHTGKLFLRLCPWVREEAEVTQWRKWQKAAVCATCPWVIGLLVM